MDKDKCEVCIKGVGDLLEDVSKDSDDYFFYEELWRVNGIGD